MHKQIFPGDEGVAVKVGFSEDTLYLCQLAEAEERAAEGPPHVCETKLPPGCRQLLGRVGLQPALQGLSITPSPPDSQAPMTAGTLGFPWGGLWAECWCPPQIHMLKP